MLRLQLVCLNMAESTDMTEDVTTNDEGEEETQTMEVDAKKSSSHAPSSLILPKRPMSAFLLFSLDKRKEFPNMPLLESTQKLSVMWKNATDKEKEIYQSESTVRKDRYKKEMAALAAKYPDAVLSKKKRSKSTTVEVTEKAPTKRGQKRKAASPVAPTPTESNSTSTTGTRSRPSYQDVKVPGTEIAVFTPEFLDYNKKLNAQLMQLRKTNNDLQSENSRLEESIVEQEQSLALFQNKVKKQKEQNEKLEQNLKKLQDTIVKALGDMNPTTPTSAESLLEYLLSSNTGNIKERIGSAVKTIKEELSEWTKIL